MIEEDITCDPSPTHRRKDDYREEETSVWATATGATVALKQSERMVDSARFRALIGALVIFAPLTLALSKNDLYPYATPGSNTLKLDPSGQLASVEAILKTPIVFYDNVYNAIFVSIVPFFFFSMLHHKNKKILNSYFSK